MLFNDWMFIFVFLPITLVLFFLIGKKSTTGALIFLALASLVFYGYWKIEYTILVIASIVFNYISGRIIRYTVPLRRRKVLLFFAVAINIGLIGYYKYANFVAQNVNALFDSHVIDTDFTQTIILPLAISFFTFTQIAYLVSAYRQEHTDYDFLSYALFVLFFPHLIAGPIIHHWELIPQIKERPCTFRFDDFTVGTAIFLTGLCKKVLLADLFASFANPVFQNVGMDIHPGLVNAWVGVLSYTLQLYFDFSGYSDMAIGLSRMFGWKFPINFDSPYKARSIVDFWRRWHMTLSQFLTKYVYISLGGNRKGNVRRYINLMATMLIGGLWHGAAWTFIFWGFLHGFYLCINHGWNALVERQPAFGRVFQGRAGAVLATAITFTAVIIGWVFFRATSFHGALLMFQSMAGLHGMGMPAPSLLLKMLMIPVGLYIVFFLPNTQQLFAGWAPAIQTVLPPVRHTVKRFGFALGMVLGILLFMVVRSYFNSTPSPFLYFNF